jgi:hypothetical protein
MKLRTIKDFINNGLSETLHEKKQFDKDFSRVSDNIVKQKAAMKEKAKQRNLIRNK